jgi:heme-degrading monooxygenase HmoA
MWAQLITTRVKPGKESELPRLVEEMRKAESAHSGFIRATLMQDQNDPSRVLTLVVFESEEKARARENDPQRQKDLEPARALMEAIYDGAPEFVDLTVLEENTP